MPGTKKQHLLTILSFVMFSAASSYDADCRAGDWPQWRGPNRDGICTETGLLKSWPDDGPKLLWEVSGLGRGYSGVAIVSGRLYTMGDVPLESGTKQCILAYDLSTRERLWAAEVGEPHSDGPRCTPTVDGGFAYAVGTGGNVVCVAADTGELRWRRNLQDDLGGGKNPSWKFSESPLIDGEKLLCTPGGRNAVMAALDKRTGEPVWKCSMPNIGRRGKDEAGYSSIIAADIVGIRQYIQLTNKGLVGVAAEDGRFLWGYNKIANDVANIPTPVVYGDSVFCSTAYNTGSALIRLSAAADGVVAEEVYFLGPDTFQNHHGGFVKVGDYIYGGHGHNQGAPTCVEIKTGKIMWQQAQPGKGSAAVLYADGRLYFRYQDNVLALIEADPGQYNLKSTFKIQKRRGMTGNGWAHPVIVDGKLYIRHADVLLVYDVKE